MVTENQVSDKKIPSNAGMQDSPFFGWKIIKEDPVQYRDQFTRGLTFLFGAVREVKGIDPSPLNRFVSVYQKPGDDPDASGGDFVIVSRAADNPNDLRIFDMTNEYYGDPEPNPEMLIRKVLEMADTSGMTRNINEFADYGKLDIIETAERGGKKKPVVNVPPVSDSPLINTYNTNVSYHNLNIEPMGATPFGYIDKNDGPTASHGKQSGQNSEDPEKFNQIAQSTRNMVLVPPTPPAQRSEGFFQKLGGRADKYKASGVIGAGIGGGIGLAVAGPLGLLGGALAGATAGFSPEIKKALGKTAVNTLASGSSGANVSTVNPLQPISAAARGYREGAKQVAKEEQVASAHTDKQYSEQLKAYTALKKEQMRGIQAERIARIRKGNPPPDTAHEDMIAHQAQSGKSTIETKGNEVAKGQLPANTTFVAQPKQSQPPLGPRVHSSPTALHAAYYPQSPKKYIPPSSRKTATFGGIAANLQQMNKTGKYGRNN